MSVSPAVVSVVVVVDVSVVVAVVVDVSGVVVEVEVSASVVVDEVVGASVLSLVGDEVVGGGSLVVEVDDDEDDEDVEVSVVAAVESPQASGSTARVRRSGRALTRRIVTEPAQLRSAGA